MSDTYWAQPVMSEAKELSIELFNRVAENIGRYRAEPDLMVMHPVAYRAYKRWEEWMKELNALLRDAAIRAAWMSGWDAANSRRSERRKQKEWNRWCEAKATAKVDARKALDEL